MVHANVLVLCGSAPVVVIGVHEAASRATGVRRSGWLDTSTISGTKTGLLDKLR